MLPDVTRRVILYNTDESVSIYADNNVDECDETIRTLLYEVA